jgi:hypothetical protein
MHTDSPHSRHYVTILNDAGVITYIDPRHPGLIASQLIGQNIRDLGPSTAHSFGRIVRNPIEFWTRSIVQIDDVSVPFHSHWLPIHVCEHAWIMVKSVVSFPGFHDLSVADITLLELLVMHNSLAACAEATGESRRTIERRLARIRKTTETATNTDLLWRAKLELSHF